MRSLFYIFLALALILETTFTTIPLLLIFINLNTVVYKRSEVFLPALLFGAIFDILSVKTVGTSSILFISFSLFVLLYQRKFEIETSLFVAISTFFGSLVYLFFIFSKFLFWESVLASIIAVLIFKLLRKIDRYG